MIKIQNDTVEVNPPYLVSPLFHVINISFLIADLCPTCAAYYGNRAATYIMMNKYREALEDARQSTRLDNKFVKVKQT